MRLITSIFRDKLRRNPTDVELMDLFQSNNEHCRRYLCNGKVVVDGDVDAMAQKLAEMTPGGYDKRA